MVTVKMRQPFSPFHIWAAAHFSKLSATTEADHAGEDWIALNDSGVFNQHRGYVMGAIFSSVAYLEATINELFKDCVDAYTVGGTMFPPGPATHISEATRTLLAERWRQGAARFDTLSKYQTALILAGAPPLETNQNPYQDASSLTRLRNGLIHYEPEFVEAGAHSIELRLKGKFAENALMPSDADNPFYPDRCLGHGCAKWSVESGLALTSEFQARMGTKPVFDTSTPLDTG